MILTQNFSAPDWKRIIELADQSNVKQGGSFEVGQGRIVLRDSAGGRWRLNVSTSGVVTATAVTS